MPSAPSKDAELFDTFLGTPIFIAKNGQFKATIGHSYTSMASLASIKKKIADEYSRTHNKTVKLTTRPSAWGMGMTYDVTGLAIERGETMAKTRYGTHRISNMVWPDEDLNKEAEALQKAHEESEKAYKNAMAALGQRYRQVTLEDLKAALEGTE